MPSRILVLDDNDSILEMLRDLLASEGYRVEVGNVAVTDLNEIDEMKPDLIVLDNMFSGLPDGWTMLQALKLRLSTKSIPVIFSSAATVKEEIRQYCRDNDVAVLVRPFAIDELLRDVVQGLETSGSNGGTSGAV